MAHYKHFLTVLFAFLFFFTYFITSEPSIHKLYEDEEVIQHFSAQHDPSFIKNEVPKIANLFHKIIDSIHGNKLSDKAQEADSRTSFDISVFPSCRKYKIIVERLKERDWGQTYKLTIDPFAKEEDVREYEIVAQSFAKIFENVFSGIKGDDNYNFKHRRMEYEFQVIPTNDKYKLVVKRVRDIKYGRVFRIKLVSMDVYVKTIMYFVVPEDKY
ncbi:10194_t:CDS:2 [Ambispora leptoticha]|uniref:10194_t:CDS:1 n=1 Tax=Ambispora leptoticha TaxID=144679 RepID=A0A9N9GDB7_9GLOM|nr:10194_t:CDS:2 [Ambispora leptoticha]